MDILRTLRQETLFARQRVYQAGEPTPLEPIELEVPGNVFVKREDLSPIKAYKWRGAFNRMALLSEDERKRPVVAASAGNHAQGVALAARILDLRAKIYMPRTTPVVKREAVYRHGGEHVEIILEGDGYDDALAAALIETHANGNAYIHAYDDLLVMAGQATLADEIVMSGEGPFDVAYLQIGGGGMAGGVANWLKTFYPKIRIVGVEGVEQASMKAAVEAGKPTPLEALDIFCDGTAVRQAGEVTFEVCRQVIDEFITVTNEEVSDAIRLYWERLRCLLEPSGAMGLAGLLKDCAASSSTAHHENALIIGCGANLDFGKLAVIADSAGIGAGRRRHLRIQIPEKPGSMLELLETGLGRLNIIDFQYGKVDPAEAWPVFGMVCSDPEHSALEERLRSEGYKFEEVDDSVEVRFRAIPCDVSLLHFPVFLELDFYERAGALLDFLQQIVRSQANFCYFNYRYTGERVGRALIGLEFDTQTQAEAFLAELPPSGDGYRYCRPLSNDEINQIVGKKD
ncbi:pyridoxal-phosphate dependent enzyme [Rubellicoccus peritrichatus]|uniref:threonine ammonia-lyase n=1 Tax=Rubellicoccus peritrichatus TaxID=3080537 RepID=A0AAQ3LDL5_9BACT|nr:pyridoxal-phosphate dependent enzyme [Puniceicoccus sp. CR14]WOO42607.1 pyridoxal-phosphate dependent enzyme [Puniceicoccus sp. CR14]